MLTPKRRIFRATKRKRRCPCQSCDRKFHRDARQNCVEGIPSEKETRSFPRSRAPRNLFAALHHGNVHADPLRHGNKTCAPARSNRLRRIYRSNIVRCSIDVLFRRALVGNHSNLSLVFVHHGFNAAILDEAIRATIVTTRRVSFQ